MGFIPQATVDAMRGVYNLGLFFRLDTDPALHLWWGVSDIPAKIPNLDDDGTVYTGGGTITEIPDALEVLINGSAERVDWTMPGVSPQAAAKLHADAPSVVGKAVRFGFCPLDARWQMMGDIFSAWEGTADFWAMERKPQQDVTKDKTLTLTLATKTGNESRALPYFSTWTDRVQRSLFTGDRFCERVARYYPGLLIRWPRF